MNIVNITPLPDERVALEGVNKFLSKVTKKIASRYPLVRDLKAYLEEKKAKLCYEAMLNFHDGKWRLAELQLQVLEQAFRLVYEHAIAPGQSDWVTLHLRDYAEIQVGDILKTRQVYAKRYEHLVQPMTARVDSALKNAKDLFVLESAKLLAAPATKGSPKRKKKGPKKIKEQDRLNLGDGSYN